VLHSAQVVRAETYVDAVANHAIALEAVLELGADSGRRIRGVVVEHGHAAPGERSARELLERVAQVRGAVVREDGDREIVLEHGGAGG